MGKAVFGSQNPFLRQEINIHRIKSITITFPRQEINSLWDSMNGLLLRIYPNVKTVLKQIKSNKSNYK